MNIKKLKNVALSDKDCMKLVQGRARMVTYPELYKYKSLDELLGKEQAIFLLFELKPSYGHWCAVFKQDEDTIEFFDSYGTYLDNELKWIDVDYRKKSHQMYPYLTALFVKSPYKNLTYNEHKFQKHDNNIRTCGRWAALRLVFRDLPLDMFAKLFKGKNSDDLVTILTSPDLSY
jgi:hypothetical protein